MKYHTIAIIGLIALASAQQKLNVIDIGRTVEGILYGVLEQEFPAGALDTCINQGENIEVTLLSAVHDLELGTFEGVKKGLGEAGAAIKMVPTLVKDCVAVEGDIEKLVKMAEIFEHPWSLIYHVGKSLIVNGADIFSKVEAAVNAFRSGKYFEFG